MKKLYFLNEEEKERILKLHESATRKQYLSEDMDGECNECGKSNMYEYSDLDEADAGDVGSKALTGAATGAAIAGPAGAVAGAVIGAAYGLIAGSGGSYAGVEKIFQACKASGVGATTMNGGTLDAIAKKLYDAVRVWNGTDEDAIKSALSQVKTIPDLCAVDKRYAENYPGYTLLDDLDGDIDSDSEWNEYVYQPLLAAKRKSEELGKTAQAAKTTTSSSTGGWAGKGDPDRYWNALVAALKSVGINAKTENPNFMYWNMWVVYKDYNKNGGYPITVGKGDTTAYFKFADYGGKYAGQSVDKINVIMKGNETPIPWLPLLQRGGEVAKAAVGAATGASAGKTTQTVSKTASPVSQSNIKQVQKLIGVAETGVFDDVTAKAVRTKLGA